MNDKEVAEQLKSRGYRLGEAIMRNDGMLLWRVNDVFMFRKDAVDLAENVATTKHILTRNDGQIFPGAENHHREQDIMRRVDDISRQVVAGRGIEINVVIPYETSEREDQLIRNRVAQWLDGTATVR
jgi:hypothetical protein